jgi:hypothetical protein
MANKTKLNAPRMITNHFRKRFPDYPPEYPPIAIREDRYTVWLRVVSHRFRGKNRPRRWDMLNPIIEELPREVADQLMVLVALTPDEVKDSRISREFDIRKTKKRKRKPSAA